MAASMRPKIYFDNVIVSGVIQKDLPELEMSAVLVLETAKKAGQIEIVTSRQSSREQDKANDPNTRANLINNRDRYTNVEHDHIVLGFANSQDQYEGISSNPLVSDVIDATLHLKLINAGVAHQDSIHIQNAAGNHCSHFVTLDSKDILPIRSRIEEIVPSLKIVKPTELLLELDLSTNQHESRGHGT